MSVSRIDSQSGFCNSCSWRRRTRTVRASPNGRADSFGIGHIVDNESRAKGELVDIGEAVQGSMSMRIEGREKDSSM